MPEWNSDKTGKRVEGSIQLEKYTGLYQKRKRTGDTVIYILIYLSAAIAVILLLSIIGYVVVKGIGQVNWDFLTKAKSVMAGTNGIAGNIIKDDEE